MDIYQYLETDTNEHSATNAYLLALASNYIYHSELPGGSGSFESKFVTHFRGLSDTNPLLCNGIDNNGVEAVVMSNSRAIIVAFRGTEMSIDLEWIGLGYGNLDYKFCNTPNSWSQVKIHNGFYTALKSISGEVLDNIRTLKQQQDRPVFLTGHSRGAAFSLIFAYQLKSVENIDVAGVYVYGCPRVGDNKFQERYQAAGLWDKTYRWVNYKDPANMLPDYAVLTGRNVTNQYFHVGQLNYVHSQGTVIMDRSDTEYEPIPNLASSFALQILSIGKYHEIDRYCRVLFNRLSSESRISVGDPAYLIKNDPGHVFPESKFDPQTPTIVPVPVRRINNSRVI